MRILYKHVKKRKFTIYSKFINLMIRQGKKKKALNFFYNALIHLKVKFNIDPLSCFEKAIINTTPRLGVTKKYLSGRSVVVPYILSKEGAIKKATYWIVKCARERGHTEPFHEKLASEIHDASLFKGKAIIERRNTHDLALENRANIRYY